MKTPKVTVYRWWQWPSVRWLGFLLLAAAAMQACKIPTPTISTKPKSPPGVVPFLNETISWYQQLAIQQEIANDQTGAAIMAENRAVADQAVRQAFEFAKAQIPAQATTQASSSGQSGASQQSSGGNQPPATSQYSGLAQLSATIDKQISDNAAEMEDLRAKLDTAPTRQRGQIQAQISELQSELDLSHTRQDAIQTMLDFASTANNSTTSGNELRDQINALARSLPPEVTRNLTTQESGTKSSTEKNQGATASAAPPVSSPTSVAVQTPPTGIWGLAEDIYNVTGNIRTLDSSIQATQDYASSVDALRTPMINNIRSLAQQGDTLAKQADTTAPAQLEAVKKQIDGLTAQFKQAIAAALPLNKEAILLDVYERNQTAWRSSLQSRSKSELKRLLLHLVGLGIVLTIVIFIGEFWRRAIFKYVHDARLKHQFLLMRRVVMWCFIGIVIALAFATQIGSVATFAGLITAGVAVALQSVILSIAGYFFLIGRFGIRVGDRVQISGVTGEVVEVGLVRLFLMELSGGAMSTPTGRVVAFANSFVFQATTGVFKQVPGTNFLWHEVALSVPSGTNVDGLEKRLLDAVDGVFKDYRDELMRQQRQMQREVATLPITELRPRCRLKFTGTGIEVSMRYPVTTEHANEMDNRITHVLVKAMEEEPAVKSAGGVPSVKLQTNVNEGNEETKK